MEVVPKFQVLYTEDVQSFLASLEPKVRDKIIYNIEKSRLVMDKDLFKKMGDTDIWEFRTLYNGISYRLLSFWDTEDEALVIAAHGFVKKSNKTPPKEIVKAEAIRIEYFELKKK